MRQLFIPAILLFAAPAFAQVTAGSGATATAQTAPIVFEGDEATTKLKTTPGVMLPGNAVSSGGFNCAATGSAGVSGMGFAVGASAAKSLEDCVKLNLLSFTVAAKDAGMYEAVWCSIPAGREAYVEAGLDCPADRRAGRKTTALNSQPAGASPVHSPQ